MKLTLRSAYPFLAAAGAACLSEATGPLGHRLALAPQILTFGALGDTARLAATEIGPGGSLLPMPALSYASVARSVATVDDAGLVTAHGNGATWIVARSASGQTDSVPVTVLQQAARIVASRDTLRFEALGEAQALGVQVVDRQGLAIASVVVSYSVDDSAIVVLEPGGAIRARANGLTTVRASGAGESVAVVVRVQQRPVRVVTNADSLHFMALGETATVMAVAVDPLGHAVPGGIAELAVEDTAVLALVDSVTVRAKQNGRTRLRFTAGGLPVEQLALVAQVPDTIIAALVDTQRILSLGLDSLIPVACQVLDRNQHPMSVVPVVRESAGGLWIGSSCGDLRVLRSGVDTLQVTYGSLQAAIRVAVAIRPMAGTVEDVVVQGGAGWIGDPWAPSADTAPDGTIELYFGNYVYDATTDDNRSDLERLLSTDGLHFQHDTLMLRHGADIDSADGRGIENAVVFPAADGVGWRMLYAGGNETGGWSVFGATSGDRRSWVKSGQVIGNGYPGIIRPAGEGMVIDRLPDGSWRLLMGAYEPSPSVTNTFSITEWHSRDQATWTFMGARLAAADLPLAGVRVVYAPSVRQIGPSLWRMAFTADNFSGPPFSGGTSSIWTAVSGDFQHWQIEGVLVSVPGANVMYSALAKDHIYFIRRGADGINHLATTVVEMP